MVTKSGIAFALLSAVGFSNSANAASVNCAFMSETVISQSGEWVKSEADFMKMVELFGDGLKLNLESSLLGKLDSKQPFLAGKVKRGSVYLMGSEIGVQGKLIIVTDDQIAIYDGMCQVGFG